MFGIELKKKRPEEVFIPRSAEVDMNSYISREDIEKELIRAVRGTKNILIRGESGCGKTWLYKKVFNDEKIKYEPIIDLAEAAKSDMTIEKAIEKALDFGEKFVKEGYSEKKDTEISAAGLAKGGLGTQTNYVVRKNALERIYKKLGGEKEAVLVLDNVEYISDSPERLKELNSMLMKIDSKEYSQYNVKILVVGTPNGVKKFYNNIDNLDTISNRLEEIKEVKGLENVEKVTQFFEKTMVNQLKYQFDDKDKKKLCKYIFDITGGVPQRLHEYCLRLCYAIEDSGNVTKFEIHKKADIAYVNKSYQKYVTNISKAMNSYATDIQRRNQVLYALGKIKDNTFRTDDIKSMVKKQFSIPESENIQITQSLNELSNGDNAILTKMDDRWMFSDSQYSIVLRLILEKRNKKVSLKNDV